MSRTSKRYFRAILPFAIGLGTACGERMPGQRFVPPLPGLEATPHWLAFTCVEPGCETTFETEVGVIGTRPIAIKRIVMTDRDRHDFVIQSERTPPFILEPSETFTLKVTYRPTGDPRWADASLRVTYGDASPQQSESRIEPGELEIALVPRLIGEPRLSVDPEFLTFGAVRAPGEKALVVTLRNTGFGNVGLVFESLETSAPDLVRIDNLPTQPLLPGEHWDLSVAYTPTNESVLQEMLTVLPLGSAGIPAIVPLLGTSISTPRLVTEPETRIDFGEVNVGSSATAQLRLSNLGATSLVVSSVEVFEPIVGPLEVGLTGAETNALAALASRTLVVTFRAATPGQVHGRLEIVTSDPERPRTTIRVSGVAARPELIAEPAEIIFGAVPRGWTEVRPIELRNAGYGELTLTHVSLILGSSELFALRTLPSLPTTLRHNERLGLEIEFRSEAAARFSGTLSVDTSDPDQPFVEIPLSATGASCEQGCPIQNGTPSCSGGVCAIRSCHPHWYDTDRDPATGCECAEIDRDPGSFCADSTYLGTIADDGSTRTFRGILPEDGDEDVIRFFAYDRSEFFDDDFDVRVSLESTDPSIQFCIHRHRTDRHLNECHFGGENCPTRRSFRDDGAFGTDDSADYIIEIRRQGGVAPTCTPYTLFVRNG